MRVDWLAVLPLLFLAGGGVATFCAGAFWRRAPSWLVFAIALAAAVSSGASAAFVNPFAMNFVGMLDVGDYARYFNVIIAAITAISLLFAFQYAGAGGFSIDEFYGVVLFAALGMQLVVGAMHWVIFFLGVELLSIALYVLIAMRKGRASSNEAGLKYFVMGAVSSAVLLFGIALIYAATGAMDIGWSLGPYVNEENLTGVLIGFGLIMVGIGFKVSLVPFHLWTPDVYQGAPAPVTAFMSTGSKVALIAALMRFLFAFNDVLWSNLLPILWTLAVLTMVVGNVTAVVQMHVKRLLAYSSMAHVGYMLMALLAIRSGSAVAVMFYLAVYALMEIGAFGTVALLSAGDEDLDELEDYRGFGFVHPWKSALLTVSLFSLAGLPPAAGFMGKVALFEATLRGGYLMLAVIGILSAIVSIYYYLKIVVTLYMGAPEHPIAVPRTDLFGGLAGTIVLFLILWLGVVPSSLFNVITSVLW